MKKKTRENNNSSWEFKSAECIWRLVNKKTATFKEQTKIRPQAKFLFTMQEQRETSSINIQTTHGKDK